MHFLGSAQYKINIFLCRNWQKTSCELCCYADENVDMLSVTMPDGNRLPEGAYSHLPMGL